MPGVGQQRTAQWESGGATGGGGGLRITVAPNGPASARYAATYLIYVCAKTVLSLADFAADPESFVVMCPRLCIVLCHPTATRRWNLAHL